MIKAVIFDLDGTLLDSMPYWTGTGEKYLRKQGINVHENLDEILKTFTFKQSAEYFREHYGLQLSVGEIVDGLNEIIDEHYKNDIPLKPGARQLLEMLNDRGIKMCVATAAEKVHAITALSRLGVLGYFSGIFICSEFDCDKTEPTIYRIALNSLGTKKQETAVFEDTCYALENAKKDGFFAVAVFDPWEIEQDRMKELADVYLTSLTNFKI